MHKFLGEESFRDGVSNYLKKHEYKNAKQDDLWAALTETSHKNLALPSSFSVKSIMDTWTLQVGYPIISVERDYETHSAKLSQTRYLSDRVRSRDEKNSCWWIPLTYTDSEKFDFNISHAQDWLSCTDDQVPEPKTIQNLPDKDHWVIFNIQLAGLYKIKYDWHNYKLIVKTLNSERFAEIDPINRAQLIDDAMDLAWTGQQNYGIAVITNLLSAIFLYLGTDSVQRLREGFAVDNANLTWFFTILFLFPVFNDQLLASRKRVHSMEGGVG